MLFIIVVVSVSGTLASFFWLLGVILSKIKKEVKPSAITLGICIIVFIISFLSIKTIYAQIYNETVEIARDELVSMQDNGKIAETGIAGAFYVSISFEEVDVYSYYYKNNGGYKRGRIISNDVTIYEDDGCTPQMITYEDRRKTKLGKGMEDFLIFGTPDSSKIRYEIIVPKGTVVQNFELDAK